MRATIIPVLALSALLCLSADAKADMLTLTFHRIEGTGTNPAGQLFVDVLDKAEAVELFGLPGSLTNPTAWDPNSMGSTDVLFLVRNEVGINSNIHEVYFDDGTILAQSLVINSLGGFTNFVGGGANPGNLPGGGNADPDFVATTAFSVDLNNGSGGQDKGVNHADDILGIVYTTQAIDHDNNPNTPAVPQGYSGIVASLETGLLRVGIHVGSIGGNEVSQGFVNDPVDPGPDPGPTVPEPATLVLLGMGGIGFLGHRLLRLKRGSAA